MRDYQERVTTWQTDTRTDRQTHRHWTKWCLCAAMLCRWHKTPKNLHVCSWLGMFNNSACLWPGHQQQAKPPSFLHTSVSSYIWLKCIGNIINETKLNRNMHHISGKTTQLSTNFQSFTKWINLSLNYFRLNTISLFIADPTLPVEQLCPSNFVSFDRMQCIMNNQRCHSHQMRSCPELLL